MDLARQENEALDHSNFMSRKIIEETAEDEKLSSELDAIKPDDRNKIFQMLDEDARRKDEFMLHEASHYTQLAVISEIRRDFTNDDPFVRHLLNVEKAIKKAIKINFDERDKWKEHQDNIVRVFYMDINIGFITSTGQIKSTAFVFVNHAYAEGLNHHRVNLQFKSQRLHITLNFIDPRYVMPQKEPPIISAKTSFIRNQKFKNQYIILSKSWQEPKEGIQIYFVYHPIDDQIYAIKRSMLISKQFTFYSIFQRSNLEHPDQRKISEARILSKLTHPNILRMYDWWLELEEGCFHLYMQLEYCSFPGFKYQPNDLLSFAYFYMNPMSNETKLHTIKDILQQVLEGLEYIHKRGIMHRDLKAENIFVTISITGELQIRLADFDQGRDLNDIRQELPIVDEFYGIGILLLHLVLTFPGEPKNRNHYVKTFSASDPEDVYPLFDSWASKLVRNRHPEFRFVNFKSGLDLSKKLMTCKIKDHHELKMLIQSL